jgi:hypothetical protein
MLIDVSFGDGHSEEEGEDYEDGNARDTGVSGI